MVPVPGGKMADNKNTMKKTKFDVRIVRSYLRRVGEMRELLEIPVEDLDGHLARFIASHRKQDGTEYEPGTLRGILGSLDRHFERSDFPWSIYRSRDTRFVRTVGAMREKQRYLRALGKGNPPTTPDPLTEEEIRSLYRSGTLGLHSPISLVRTVYLHLHRHLRLRPADQHRLMWGDIALGSDPRGHRYLEYSPPGKPPVRVYDSDAVRAYDKYSRERPERMRRREAPFYLTPRSDRPGPSAWYRSIPMGENRVRGIMRSLKAAARTPQPGNRVPETDETDGEKSDNNQGNLICWEQRDKWIKSEWGPDEESTVKPEEDSEEDGLLPQQVSVTFRDVAACFSAKEWDLLKDCQKELYSNVIRQIHVTLMAMGCTIVNSDVLLKIKDEDIGITDHGQSSTEGVSLSPDLLLRIKNEEIDDWKDEEPPTKEPELDTSTSNIPVFDPDLSMWIFKEEPNLCPSENGSDHVLPNDADEEVHIPPSSPSPFKDPIAEIPTPFTFPETPRPGKRKRRPPQRRSEQTLDTDEDEQLNLLGEFNRSLPSLEDNTDWVPHGRMYQCNLCERSFSDQPSLLRAALPGMGLSCPQCGGTLTQHPSCNRLPCVEMEENIDQTFGFSSHAGGYSHHMEGPVG
ncbi:hypothetical protein GDO86_019900 [Hymenochirus boettgeri]|uniref:KRAB domain-containing protein n=1 Tax=Hymenochirus boettgeri TaxID=247094 RepID=A0A8T2II62_9PIPI|nr:hypothetical protein GDO86_019900 [Hymenochirus boettgeri]